MTLPNHINDREYQSFRDTGVAGETKKAVIIEQETPVVVSSPLVTVAYDSIYASYPDTVTEVYEFKNLTILVATVTIIYSDSTKENLVSVVRT